jgi:hypothetical protein
MTVTRTRKDRPASEAYRALLDGYRSLSLDPSPRLRQIREDMSRPPEEAIESAWKVVGRALLKAMRTFSETLAR